MKNYPSRALNPPPLEYEAPPKTARPGLLPKLEMFRVWSKNWQPTSMSLGKILEGLALGKNLNLFWSIFATGQI